MKTKKNWVKPLLKEISIIKKTAKGKYNTHSDGGSNRS